jgi:FOG: Ankyrin repeat
MNNNNLSSGQDAVDPNCTQMSPDSSPLVHETDECSEAQKTTGTETVRDEEISPDIGAVLREDHGDTGAKVLNVELEVPSLNAQQRGALLNADEDKVDKVKSTTDLTADDETFEDKVGVDDGIDMEASSTKSGSVETETKNIEERKDSDNLDNASHDQKNGPTAPLLKVLFTSMDGRATNDFQNVVLSDPVSVFEKGRFFWSSGQYVRKMLVLYEKPHYLLVIARQPRNAAEVRRILETSGDSCMELNDSNDIDLIKSFCIAEKLIDLKICKLRLSSLTTPTSKLLLDKSDGELSVCGNMDCQAKTCFEVITPKENLLMSFEIDGLLNSSDSGGDTKYLQSICEITKRWENGISRAIIEAHDDSNNVNDGDMAWRHQLILGTLHSHIVTGNYDLLQQVLAGKGSPDSPSAHINERDDAGFTALHYACLRRSHKAVSILLAAGADCSIPSIKGGKSPCHLCCEQLDDESLSIILSSSKPKRADPNALDEFHNTPMYVTLIMGKSPVGGRNPMKCLRTLEAWGGQIMLQNSDENRSEKHPIYILSSKCDSEGLKVAFHFFQFRFPFLGDPLDGYGRSLSAIYCYPIHAILISLRMKLNKVRSGNNTDALHGNYVDAVKR